MNLVIVESPTKAKTISKFLGSGYKIESSYGHIRDLPENTFGVDVKNNFEPTYVIAPKAKRNLAKLKKLAEKADTVVLATDEDREGEAIAWHLSAALKISHRQENRIVFHEITKGAIEEALRNPRQIDMKLVDAQQARRILDRLVGYELSPFLWKKVAKGLSAGRVQSVAVRMIVERERQVKDFKPEEYWTIEAKLHKKEENKQIFLARLHKINNEIVEPHQIKNSAAAEKIKAELRGAKYIVGNIERKQTLKHPPKPFTTSTLQQIANRWLGFSAKQTMFVAQQLYEGVEIAEEGSIGLITYMRTDSVSLSEKFLAEAKHYLQNFVGEKYALPKSRRYKTSSRGAQEAHEAIRPTEADRTPESIKDSLNKNQYKLYKLIWQRALASQMPSAIIDATGIDINTHFRQSPSGQAQSATYQFRATGQVIQFDGFLKIYPEKSEEIDLPVVNTDEELTLVKLLSNQHFTKPPARYSDAGLVKALERYGIGRPSTYAPTIATIEARNYAERDEHKKLKPTDIAFIVNDLLVNHFQEIVNYEFTAKMEDDLDRIAQGEITWQPIIKNFYQPWHANLEQKSLELKKANIMPEEKSSEKCDKCGAPMVIKTGRYGKFLACSAFPNCRNIKSLNGQTASSGENNEEINKLSEKYKAETCEKCGAPMVIKSGRYGPFLACSAYPKCKNIKNIKENGGATGIKCPACSQGEIVAKKSRRGIFYACNRYPECKNAYWNKPTGEKCPDCESLLVEDKTGVKCSNRECGYMK